VRTFGGLGILAQAGIAIGLCMIVEQHFKNIGPTITSTVLAAVVLFEIAGPVILRWVLIKSGEVKLIDFLYRPQPFQFGEFVVTRLKQLLGLFSHKEGHNEGPLLVKHLMRTQVETIAEDTPFDQILKIIEHSKYNQFPVVDREDKFTGLIAFQEIRDSLYDETIRNLIIAKDLAVPPKATVTPGVTLEAAIEQFRLKDVDFIPVVDEDDSGHLVGILKQGDVLAVFRERK
jgi:CBS domain-containing protein